MARIAYLVLAHEDPRHVGRLAQRLGEDDVWIHLDRKVRRTADWAGVRGNFVPDPTEVDWAGFSQVEATLRTLRAAFNSSAGYTHFMLLSGACYPVRPLSELQDLLDRQPSMNFIKWVEVEDSVHLRHLVARRAFRGRLIPRTARRWPLARLTEKALRRGLEVVANLIPKRAPQGVRLTHGSAYWCLTREAVEYTLGFVDSKPGRKYRRFYRQTFASDEQFFHTIVANSSPVLAATGRHHDVRRGTYLSANLHLVHPSLSKWYELSDLSEVRISEVYFIRKVSSDKSSALLNALDELDTHGAAE